MARSLRDENGVVQIIEFSEGEMAQALGIEAEELRSWQHAIPPYARSTSASTLYRIHSVKELNHLKKRVAILRTRMSEQAVANIEEAGLLDAYAALAEDCPQGLTVHVWRSYALVVLMQVRYGKMIGVKELAERAKLVSIDPESGEAKPDLKMAQKHLRLLQSVDGGWLKIGTDKWTGQWEHRGLPQSWRDV